MTRYFFGAMGGFQNNSNFKNNFQKKFIQKWSSLIKIDSEKTFEKTKKTKKNIFCVSFDI